MGEQGRFNLSSLYHSALPDLASLREFADSIVDPLGKMTLRSTMASIAGVAQKLVKGAVDTFSTVMELVNMATGVAKTLFSFALNGFNFAAYADQAYICALIVIVMSTSMGVIGPWTATLLNTLLLFYSGTSNEVRVAITAAAQACVCFVGDKRGKNEINVNLKVSKDYEFVDPQAANGAAFVQCIGKLFAAMLALQFVHMIPSGKGIDALLKRLDHVPKAMRGLGTMVEKVESGLYWAFGESLEYWFGVGTIVSKPIPDVILKHGERVLELCSIETFRKMPSDVALCQEISELYREHQRYCIEFNSHRAIKEYLHSYSGSLINMYLKAANHVPRENENRPKPSTLLLTGGSGIGKTNLLYFICADLMKHAGKITKEDDAESVKRKTAACMYSRNAEQEYWDAYYRQYVCLFDDFGQQKDSESLPNPEYYELIRAVNNFPYPLHMADLSQKANTYFASEYVLATTNLRKIEPASLIDAEAIHSRLHFCYRVTVKKECQRNPKGVTEIDQQIDPMKVLTVFKKPFSMEVYEFHPWDPKTGTDLGKPITYAQMIERLIKHHDAQRSFFHCSQEALWEHVQTQGLTDWFVSKVEEPFNIGDMSTYEIEHQRMTAFEAMKKIVERSIEQLKSMRDLVKMRVIIVMLGLLALAATGLAVWKYGSQIKDFLAGPEEEDYDENEKLVDWWEFDDCIRWRTANDKKTLKELNWTVDEMERNLNDVSSTLHDNALEYALDHGMPEEQDEDGEWTKKISNADKVCITLIWMDAKKRNPNSPHYDAAYVKKHKLRDSPFQTNAPERIEKRITKLFVESGKAKKDRLPKVKIESGRAKKDVPVRVRVESKDDATFVPESGETKEEVSKVVVESWAAKQSEELSVKIRNRCFRKLCSDDGNNTTLAPILCIGGRTYLVNYHYWTLIKKAWKTVKVCPNGSTKGWIFQVKDIESLRMQRANSDTDLVVLRFPERIMDSGPHLWKNFHHKADSYNLKGTNMILISPNEMGGFDSKSGKLVYNDMKKLAYSVDSEVVTMASRVYEVDVASEAGDCGGVYLIDSNKFRNKVASFHFAGKTGQRVGYSVPLFYEDFVELMDGEIDQVDPQGIYYTPNEMPLDGILPVGKTDLKPHASTKTSFVKTALCDKIFETTVAPAKLGRLLQEDGAGLKALAKVTDDIRVIEDQDLHRCVASVKQRLYFPTVKPEDKRVLSFEEAIQGVPDEPFLKGINRTTSAGWPHMLDTQGKKGKTKWFGSTDYIVDSPEALEVKAEVDRRITDLKNNIWEPAVYVDTLKDETRSIEKVLAGKTRVFSAGPLIYTILMRMYFLPFFSHMMKNRIRNESAVGIQAQSTDWDQLARWLTETGDMMFAGDFSEYDGRLNPSILKIVCNIINEWYDDGKVNARIREILFEDVSHSWHVAEDNIYGWTHSQPSGNPGTAIFNTMVNMILVRLCYYKLKRENCPDDYMHDTFNSDVRMIAYGDDNVISPTPEITSWFNMQSVSNAMAYYGMIYTSEDKTQAHYEVKHLTECSFLKRGFRWEDHISGWVGPLGTASIMERLNWAHKGPEMDRALEQNVDGSIAEWALHDKETFKYWSNKISKAALDHINYMALVQTHEYYLDLMWRGKYAKYYPGLSYT